MFLQTWNTMRRINKKHSLKWMIVSLIIVSTVSFGLSKVNLIDYKTLNNIALQNNIQLKYNLVVPEANCCEGKFENRSLTKVIYVVRNKQLANSTPQIFVDNQEVALNDLGLKILEFQRNLNEYEVYLCTYHLYIDKTINMKFVNELKNEMAKVNALKVAFAFVPPNARYDKRYYKNYTLRYRLAKNDSFSMLESYKGLSDFENIIEVSNTDAGEFVVNGKPILVENLKQEMKELINRNPNYYVKFYINNNVDFSVYFNLISKTKEAVDALRNEYSTLSFSKNFDDLNDEEMSETVNKYGFRIFEITNEMKKQLDD